MAYELVPFKTSSFLKQTMENYNNQAMAAAKEGIPVARVTAVFPVEILYAMDIFPYYAENFGAAAGTHRRTERLSKIAEQQGYAIHYCAYTRAGLELMYSAPDFNQEILVPDTKKYSSCSR
jgi:benzoyl-CoA reductase/2-hydroxyglutaryl-CoA dehydratase subunit BcrC/BadD/HgdB